MCTVQHIALRSKMPSDVESGVCSSLFAMRLRRLLSLYTSSDEGRK